MLNDVAVIRSSSQPKRLTKAEIANNVEEQVTAPVSKVNVVVTLLKLYLQAV